MRLSVVTRWHYAAAVFVLGVAALVLTLPSPAKAATPAHTDVMFVFDTTGSMGGAIDEAQAEIQEAMTQIGASLPDVQFGLSEVSDYNDVVNPGEFEYGIGDGFAPWTLHVPITSNQSAISAALLGLEANGGGDSPEAYGRGLFESDANPAVGWRPGARGVIVLVADDVPHDNELNEGIPDSVWYEAPFVTGVDPGADNTVGTADDLDWQGVLQRLVADGRPLEFVDYHGQPAYFPYWQNWTARTGGGAVEAGEGNLVAQLVELVKAGAGAPLPACPSGQVRDPNEHCVVPPSNNFKIEPRISCAKGCHVVQVKIVFDSAGNVIAESVLDEEAGSSSAGQDGVANASVAHPKAKCGTKKAKSSAKGKKAKCKRPALIKQLSQAVVPGLNTLSLKLTGPAVKTLQAKGKLNLKVQITFAPSGAGGTPKSEVHTFVVKAPKKGHRKGGHGKGKKH
ncbi:MAG TPA: vWA domain-containing protein [Solirubrobacterales bacterium]